MGGKMIWNFGIELCQTHWSWLKCQISYTELNSCRTFSGEGPKWLHRHSCLSICWVWVPFPSKKCISLKHLTPCCQEHCLDLHLSLEGHQLMFNEHNSGPHITRGYDPGPRCPWADQYEAMVEETIPQVLLGLQTIQMPPKCQMSPICHQKRSPRIDWNVPTRKCSSTLSQKCPKQDLLAGSR